MGKLWDVLGRLLGAFGPFRGCSKSSFFRAWAQDGPQEAFGIDFGVILEGSGRVLGGFGKVLARFGKGFGEAFWHFKF